MVCLVAATASALTLYSGFGLGTLLLPAFALFFPLPVAVAATAIVHLLNNLFKLALVGRHADKRVVLRFSIPAVLAAFLGAGLLLVVADAQPLATYELGGSAKDITVVELLIGAIIVVFAILELTPAFARLSFDRKYLPLGGALSGFFGGLSGLQGALRSAFLLKVGLSKEAYIGTGVVSAVLVDLARLLVYGVTLLGIGVVDLEGTWGLVVAATASAFIGSYAASRYLTKVTMSAIRIVVAAMLIGVGTALMVGLI